MKQYWKSYFYNWLTKMWHGRKPCDRLEWFIIVYSEVVWRYWWSNRPSNMWLCARCKDSRGHQTREEPNSSKNAEKVLSWEMKISPISISRIIRDNLRLRAYKRYTDVLKQKRKETSKALRPRYAKNAHRWIVYLSQYFHGILTVKE